MKAIIFILSILFLTGCGDQSHQKGNETASSEELTHFRKANALVLGVTEKDISTAVHGYDNYGVMGQASLGQRLERGGIGMNQKKS
jgi:hypothetical protein